MYVRVEPNGMMHSVFLTFDVSEPHAEDEAVRKYLADHRLSAKRVTSTRVEERECREMYFGGCYLGHHLNAIGEIQNRAVERELLSEEIRSLLETGSNETALQRASSMGEDELTEAVDSLAEEYHRDSSFKADDEGVFHVALDAPAVRESFLALAQRSVR